MGQNYEFEQDDLLHDEHVNHGLRSTETDRGQARGPLPARIGTAPGPPRAFPDLQLQRKIHAMQQTYGNMATLRHFGYGRPNREAVQAKSRQASPSSDALETDAEHAAESVMNAAPVGEAAASASSSAPSLASAPRIARQEAEAASEPEPPAEETAPVAEETAPVTEETESPAVEEASGGEAEAAAAPSGLIAEDDATEVDPKQMKKSAFIDQAEAAVEAVLSEELGTVSYVAARGGLLAEVLKYGQKSAGAIEKEIRQKVPGASGVSVASDYIPLIATRVREEVNEQEGGEAEGEKGGEEAVQGKARDGGVTMADDPQTVKSKLDAGHPLDGSLKSRMESSFGEDFSGVRIHTNRKAAGLSRDLNAKAFTVGQDVAFDSNEYKPGTLAGDALIAHELAHTVQQRGADTAAQSKGDQAGALESDADNSAVGVMARMWTGAKGSLNDLAANVAPSFRSGLRLQRCTNSGGPNADFQKQIVEARRIINRADEALPFASPEQKKNILDQKSLALIKVNEFETEAAQAGVPAAALAGLGVIALAEPTPVGELVWLAKAIQVLAVSVAAYFLLKRILEELAQLITQLAALVETVMMAQNVAHPHLLDEARNMAIAAGLAAVASKVTNDMLCNMLQIMYEQARAMGDFERANAIKATMKQKGCRGSRHSKGGSKR